MRENYKIKAALADRRKNSLIKITEIRLEGVREVTKRSRFCFLVLLIASCTIFIAMWNAHYSWNRNVAFPSDMKIFLDIKNCDDVKLDDEQKNQCKEIFTKKVLKDGQWIDFYDGSYYGIKDTPCVTRESLDLFNSNINGDSKTDPNIKNENCIGSVLPLDEYNRRNRAAEWAKSANISIGLLGVTIHSNELNILGTGTLAFISCWFVFIIRRENRTIVALLRDIYDETGFIEKKKGGDEWDVANLAFQGIANNLTFLSVNKDDAPMGIENIIQDNSQNISDSKINRFISFITRATRIGIFILYFIPPLIIIMIIAVDWTSLNWNSAFQPGFKKIGTPTVIFALLKYSLVAGLFFIIATLNCGIALFLSRRTQKAMKFFKKMLDNPSSDDILQQIEEIKSGKIENTLKNRKSTDEHKNPVSSEEEESNGSKIPALEKENDENS